MYVIAKANVLTVGLKEKAKALKELPVRLVSLQHGSEAARSFKTESFDSVISHWRLVDMEPGKFLRNLRGIRPDIPTIAVIQSNNPAQEIEARSLGVSAVITEDCSDDHFRQVVCAVLGLEKVEAIAELYAVKES
jgi:DNA-binding NarL/FixJ family response regulator